MPELGGERARIVLGEVESYVIERYEFRQSFFTQPSTFALRVGHSALARYLLEVFHPGLEFALYDLVRTELPNTILVSVSHRSTVGDGAGSSSSCASTSAAPAASCDCGGGAPKPRGMPPHDAVGSRGAGAWHVGCVAAGGSIGSAASGRSAARRHRRRARSGSMIWCS